MKMTMHIDEALLDRVIESYGYASKTEAVEMALRELDRKTRMREYAKNGLGLRGITNPKTYRSISDFMDVMVNVPSDGRLWNDALDLAWKMDRLGNVIPRTDAVIAASALRLGAAVMTSDAHFSRIDGLRMIAPPDEWFG